ncbi:MAG: serine hydrolase [Clostridiales bacterium]|nr:serine hydrolase [Clostridiales bacterium]
MKFEFPMTTPEAVGIPSAAVERFLMRLENKRLPMHSILMLRRGKLVFETYRKPFDVNRKHRLYSTSKSFVSVAIGILIGDGKLALDDLVTKFFPDLVPEDLHPYTAAATIRDLLMMATPHLRNDSCTYTPQKPDWAASYFQTLPTHLPGKIFSYDTTATMMLSIIVKRITGVEFTEFLRDRLFIPAGMSEDIRCIETPCGHEWGGSGVLATPRDLMKFAYTCMNGGVINGQQLIPADYIKAATSKQIDNTFTAGDYEHTFGYGYQFWRTRHNGFACRGMGAQLAICLPDQDFILVTTGDTQAIPSATCVIYEALWTEIYPYLEKYVSLPENPDAYEKARARWDGQEIIHVEGAATSPMAERISGVTYRSSGNELNFTSLCVTLNGDTGTLAWTNATGAHTLPFGIGKQAGSRFPETHYYGSRIGTPAGYGYDCVTSAAWVTDSTLHLVCYAIDDYIGTLRMEINFEDNTATVQSIKFAEWFFDEYYGLATLEA